MSTLSCKTFDCGPIEVTVFRRKNAVDIEFKTKPISVGADGSITGNSVSTNTIRLGNTDHFIPNQQIVARGNYDLPDRVGYIQNVANTSTINTSTNSHCTGYRLFMQNGLLKAVKKEIAALSYSHYATYSSGNVTVPTTALSNGTWIRQSFYHPASIMDYAAFGKDGRDFIQECVDSLAKQHGVVVPDKFKVHGEHYNGVSISGYMAILDWLAYPLVRELDDVVVCKNMLHGDRNLIAPKFCGMNFRDLVQRHYGRVTTKMLEEIWKVVAVGSELRKRVFAIDVLSQARLFQPDDGLEILEDNGDHVIQTGTRHIQPFTFILGPAILNTMGFDYFYQALPYLSVSFKRSFDPFEDGSSKKIEFDLATLLKHVSPKKFISALFQEGKKPDFHSLYDTASMIREYETVERIPRQLRLQYPTGLTVDFKFKTIKELHDKISIQYTILKTEASKKEIPVSDLYGLLNGRERDGCRLVVPNNTVILSIWGKLLNICVASYGDRAADGRCLILGVEKDGEIKYCIEFYSLVVQRLKQESMVGVILDPCKASEPMIEPEKISMFYPKLEEKHRGVMPPDEPEESAIYYMPAIAQFRGARNCDPDPQDKIVVDNMLAEWVEENFAYLSSLKGIFEIKSWASNGYDGAILNENAINNAFVNLNLNVGQPDRLIMNPRDYQAVIEMVNGVNVIVDHNVPPNEIRIVEQRAAEAIADQIDQIVIQNIGLAP